MSIHIETFWETKKLYKSHFTLISGHVFTKEKVIGELDQQISKFWC